MLPLVRGNGLMRGSTPCPYRLRAGQTGRFARGYASFVSDDCFSGGTAGAHGNGQAKMHKYPKISIITATLNQGQFIEETIQSVIGQDYPNIEYILIDGGSTDGTLGIIRKYEHRIDYWISEPDDGQTDALMKGLTRATGEIIGWINSDDLYYCPNVFAGVAKFFHRNPHVDLCYGGNVYIDEHGGVLLARTEVPFYSRWLLSIWNYIHQPTVFFRRHVLEAMSLDCRLHYAMDYEYWLRASRCYRFKCIRQFMSASRWHPQCKTISDGSAFFSELKAIHGKIGAPALARIIPPRVTARVFYNLQRLWSLGSLGRLRSTDRFKSIRIGALSQLVKRQVLGLGIGHRRSDAL